MSWWAQTARETQANQNDINRYATQPFIGDIVSIDADGEAVNITMPVGPLKAPLPQPFLSENAWFRGVPEGGGKVLLQQTAGGGEPAIIRYFSAQALQRARANAAIAQELRSDPTKRDVAARATSNYRSLRPGEMHAANTSGAEVYWSDRGTLEMRGGVVSRQLIATDAESFDRAPLHRRTTLLYRHGDVIGDEERYGIVKRADSDKPSFREKPILMTNPAGFTPPPSGGALGAVGALFASPKSAAKEWLVNLSWDGLPGRLYDHRIGHVFDDDAEDEDDQEENDETGQKLRAWYRWFTTPLESALDLQVDEMGNVVVAFPVEATTGLILKTTTGSVDLRLLGLLVTALQNITLSAVGKVSVTGAGGVDLTSILDGVFKAATSLSLEGTAGGVEVKGLGVMLGDALANVFPAQGVLTGETIDPLSGLPLWLFGQGSTNVFAKK